MKISLYFWTACFRMTKILSLDDLRTFSPLGHFKAYLPLRLELDILPRTNSAGIHPECRLVCHTYNIYIYIICIYLCIYLEAQRRHSSKLKDEDSSGSAGPHWAWPASSLAQHCEPSCLEGLRPISPSNCPPSRPAPLLITNHHHLNNHLNNAPGFSGVLTDLQCRPRPGIQAFIISEVPY